MDRLGARTNVQCEIASALYNDSSHSLETIDTHVYREHEAKRVHHQCSATSKTEETIDERSGDPHAREHAHRGQWEQEEGIAREERIVARESRGDDAPREKKHSFDGFVQMVERGRTITDELYQRSEQA